MLLNLVRFILKSVLVERFENTQFINEEINISVIVRKVCSLTFLSSESLIRLIQTTGLFNTKYFKASKLLMNGILTLVYSFHISSTEDMQFLLLVSYSGYYHIWGPWKFGITLSGLYPISFRMSFSFVWYRQNFHFSFTFSCPHFLPWNYIFSISISFVFYDCTGNIVH